MALKVRRMAVLAMVWAALGALAASHAQAEAGSLTTAEFPDVVEFDFDKVNDSYEQAGENVGKVVPILDSALEKGEKALQAGQKALKDPTEENKRRFVAGVVGFVRGAGESKMRIGELAEEVRGLHSQTGILYAQATTQSRARVEELHKEFEREEVKYKDIVAQNKAKRRGAKLSDWELRKLFETEKRQAQVLSRTADRITFQQDFSKALSKAVGQSAGDFTLYEQFFAEASDVLTDISDLALNLPIVVERLQIASAMAKNIPSRKAAIAGFGKIDRTREVTKKLAEQLVQLCAGDLTGGEGEEEETVIIRHTRIYKRWVDGESVEYRRPPRPSE